MGKKNPKNRISAKTQYKGGKWTNEISYSRNLNGGYVSASVRKEGGKPLAHEIRLIKSFNEGHISLSAIKEGREHWKQQFRINKDFGEKSSGYIGVSRTSGNPKSTTFEFGFNSKF